MAKRRVSLQKFCKWVFNITHKIKKVYAVTEALIASANQRNINIELGQLICNPCRNRIRKKVKNRTESVASSSSHQPDQPTRNWTLLIWMQQCMYYKKDGELKQKSMIIIAESLDHVVESVYLFQTKLVHYVTNVLQKTKIIFSTDGAPSQYKNKKNFLNLCLFKKDFEWHLMLNGTSSQHRMAKVHVMLSVDLG